jgi:HSP20 family protein
MKLAGGVPGLLCPEETLMPLSQISDFPGRPFWQPAADVYRQLSGWLIKVELAGVRLEDVSVHVSGSRVSISGRRRDFLVREGCTQYSMELSYNRFERLIDLPSNLDRAQVALELREGILIVRIDMENESRG